MSILSLPGHAIAVHIYDLSVFRFIQFNSTGWSIHADGKAVFEDINPMRQLSLYPRGRLAIANII